VLVRGEQPRQRGATFDHLEHRLLLAEEVLVGSGHDGELAVLADTRVLQLGDGTQDVGALLLEPLLQADVRACGADRERGDDDALDELVRVGAKQRAILERAGLPLGGVADDVPRAGALGGDRRPLPSRGEPTASATAQTRAIDLPAGRLWPDLLRSPDAATAVVGAQPLGRAPDRRVG
jgi:hypothetical protein